MKNTLSPKKKEIIFGVLIILIGSLFLISGYFEISKNPYTYPKTLQMGYPPYFILLLGIAKVAGVIALWQNKIKWLREWAFAGFTFDVIFAFFSGYATGIYDDCLKAMVAFIALISAYSLFRDLNRKKVVLKIPSILN